MIVVPSALKTYSSPLSGVHIFLTTTTHLGAEQTLGTVPKGTRWGQAFWPSPYQRLTWSQRSRGKLLPRPCQTSRSSHFQYYSLNPPVGTLLALLCALHLLIYVWYAEPASYLIEQLQLASHAVILDGQPEPCPKAFTLLGYSQRCAARRRLDASVWAESSLASSSGRQRPMQVGGIS